MTNFAVTLLELALIAASFVAGSYLEWRTTTKRLLNLGGEPFELKFHGKAFRFVLVPEKNFEGLKGIAGAVADHLRIEDQLVTAHMDKLQEEHVRALTRSIANVAAKFEEAGLAKRNRP